MLRWLRRRTKDDSLSDDPEAQETRAAEAALEHLGEDIRAAHERMSEIREISRTLRSRGEKNHFAPLIRDALGGRFE